MSIRRMSGSGEKNVKCLQKVRTFKRADKLSTASSQNFMERLLPLEVLIRIMSYLDASALLCISNVNKSFHRLANDNSLWRKMYNGKFGKQAASMMDTKNNPEQDPGFWKGLFLKAMVARDVRKFKSRNKPNRHRLGLTILPKNFLSVIFPQNPNLTWEVTAIDKSGQENTLEPSNVESFDTCVMVFWNGGGRLPNIREIAMFKLHVVKSIALRCPGVKRPGCRSLMLTSNLQTERVEVLGQDGLMELKLLESGLLIGVWKCDQSVAFAMFSLHSNDTERTEESSAGSWPKIYDDVDPEYGLHGYRLHLALHNSVKELMSESFSNLFCHRGDIHNHKIRLSAISRTNLFQHIRLSEEIALPWRLALLGKVEKCCFMTLTVLDVNGIPFKCVSYPVSLRLESTSVCYNYVGEHYLIRYKDSDMEVKMRLVRTEEEQQFVVISLVIYLTVSSVNKHFGRDY